MTKAKTNRVVLSEGKEQMTEIIHGDCLEVMRGMADNSVDLVFCSPPYEAARTYGIDFNLRGQAWVDWAVERYVECCRVSKGLVAWVIEGQTKQFRWTATPALFMADLHRAGIGLRKPPAYKRVGIPGSGGPDWLRNDYEFVVCASKGKLPWADNTACGHPPKFAPGGQPSHRLANGRRCNLIHTKTMKDGTKKQQGYVAPERANPGNVIEPSIDGRTYTPRLQREGDVRRVRTYTPPELSNPGNVVECHGGGGHMGSKLAHENEAPFPEKLAEFFVRSFCPPDGIVLDPFSGSGTTVSVAKKHGRRGIGIDIRESQIELAKRRIAEAA